MLRHTTRAVLVILFVLLARMVLFVAFDINLDNPLAPLLGQYTRSYSFIDVPPSSPGGPEGVIPVNMRPITEGLFLLGNRNLAEWLGSTTGIIVWVFIPSLLYALCLGRRRASVRCRKCGGTLMNLSRPECNHCGEAI